MGKEAVMALASEINHKVWRPCSLGTQGACLAHRCKEPHYQAISSSTVHSASYYLHATFITVSCKERQDDWSHIVRNVPHHRTVCLHNRKCTFIKAISRLSLHCQYLPSCRLPLFFISMYMHSSNKRSNFVAAWLFFCPISSSLAHHNL